MRVVLGSWSECTKRPQAFSTMTVFSSVLCSCPDNNALLFYACISVFMFVCVCVCTCRYNGSLPNGDRGRRKSRFGLCKRPKANGVKPSTVHVACSPQAAKVRRTKTRPFRLTSDHKAAAVS